MSYLLNISIIVVIVYRIYIGIKGGLFNEFINLANFLFSAGMSFTLFKSVAPFVYKYIFPDEQYALVIAFWVLFMLFLSPLWSIKQFSLSKIYSITKEKTVPFNPAIDKTFGAICGLLLGINLVGCIIVSLYIAPATNSFYNLREKEQIIFKADEKWVKTYSAFTDFNWKEFLDTLKPEEPPEEEEEGEESEKEEKPKEKVN